MGGWGEVCTLIILSNPTVVLCCVEVGVLTIRLLDEYLNTIKKNNEIKDNASQAVPGHSLNILNHSVQ